MHERFVHLRPATGKPQICHERKNERKSWVSDAFENILGQPWVRAFLRAAVVHDRVSHAYLFTGPAGSNKTLAAYALAQALLCPHNLHALRGPKCCECDVCRRVMQKTHPDVHYFAPEGANGYLIEQIRHIVADSMRAPILAKKKIYILDRVDLLGAAPANAFLKTLEEPPADVLLILLGRTREGVLPTIVSRCQVVPFRTIPATEAAGIIVQNSAASREQASMALAACDGSITRAIEFLQSNERMEFRRRVLEVATSLQTADAWDIICYAKDLVEQAKAPLDVVRARQEQELADNADFLTKSSLRQIDLRNKRQLSAKTLEGLQQITALISSWLRDIMVICADTPELVVNVDVRDALNATAQVTDEARAAAACVCVRRCKSALVYNVSPETCIDAMLFEIRDTLYRHELCRCCV